jgi:hypothetical protein
MAEKNAIENQALSLREFAFDGFQEFVDSIVEQSQFTPEQQLALAG